jgi:hypothetical protein
MEKYITLEMSSKDVGLLGPRLVDMSQDIPTTVTELPVPIIRYVCIG